MAQLDLPTNAILALMAEREKQRGNWLSGIGAGLGGAVAGALKRAELKRQAEELEQFLNSGQIQAAGIGTPAMEDIEALFVPVRHAATEEAGIARGKEVFPTSPMEKPQARPQNADILAQREKNLPTTPAMQPKEPPLQQDINQRTVPPPIIKVPENEEVIKSLANAAFGAEGTDRLLATQIAAGKRSFEDLLGLKGGSMKPHFTKVVLPDSQSPTGYSEFAYEYTTKTKEYIGPAAPPYGSEGQLGMPQYVGPLEDQPGKALIMIPRRGSASFATVETNAGRVSNKTLSPLSAETRNALAEYRVAYKTLNDVETLYNKALKEIPGPISGRAATAYAKIANVPAVAAIENQLWRVLTSTLKATSGLTVTDAERKIFEDHLMPMLKQPEKNFEVFLKLTKQWLKRVHDENVMVLRESNVESPNTIAELEQAWAKKQGSPANTGNAPKVEGNKLDLNAFFKGR